MNTFWKNYAKSFWKDEFFWEIVKAKSYTDEEIRKWSHLLKITKDHLTKNNIKKRNKYLKFCNYRNDQESFDIGNSLKLQVFLSCEGLNEKLFVLQKGKSVSGYNKRKQILKDYNNNFSYEKLKKKYNKVLFDFAANGRNALNWWDDWGYAIRKEYSDKTYLYITEIGNDSCDQYLNKDACLSIFRDQIKKYQIPLCNNPQLSLLDTNIGVKPYYAITQIVLGLKKKYIDKREYILFVNKVKNHEDKTINHVINLIEKYRRLEENQKKEIVEYIKHKDPSQRAKNKKSKIYQTTSENSDKSIQAFLNYSGDLFKPDNNIRNIGYHLPKSKEEKAFKIIKKFKENPAKQYHGFINEYEYNLAIGKREYENIDEILRRNYFNINRHISSKSYKGISRNEINTKQKRILLELGIQKYFEKNIDELNQKFDLKLEIQKRPGSEERQTLEFDTYVVGEIDLLCRDQISGDYYVIEIKRDEADGDTLGQIMQYMGWVSKEYRTKPKGIVICYHQSEKYSFATSYIKNNVGELKDIDIHTHDFTDENPPPKN